MTEELTALAKAVKEANAAELGTSLEIERLKFRLKSQQDTTTSATQKFGEALKAWQETL